MRSSLMRSASAVGDDAGFDHDHTHTGLRQFLASHQTKLASARQCLESRAAKGAKDT
jgi:hypothetical protein